MRLVRHRDRPPHFVNAFFGFTAVPHPAPAQMYAFCALLTLVAFFLCCSSRSFVRASAARRQASVPCGALQYHSIVQTLMIQVSVHTTLQGLRTLFGVRIQPQNVQQIVREPSV